MSSAGEIALMRRQPDKVYRTPSSRLGHTSLTETDRQIDRLVAQNKQRQHCLCIYSVRYVRGEQTACLVTGYSCGHQAWNMVRRNNQTLYHS